MLFWFFTKTYGESRLNLMMIKMRRWIRTRNWIVVTASMCFLSPSHPALKSSGSSRPWLEHSVSWTHLGAEGGPSIMPEWQDPSHSFQECLDTAMDSVRAKSYFYRRQLSLWSPVQLLVGKVAPEGCSWNATAGDMLGPYKWSSENFSVLFVALSNPNASSISS